MEARPRTIDDYLTEDGESPFREWLNKYHGERIFGIIFARFLRVEKGNLGDHESVGSGVSELRINFGPGFRIYYGEDGDLIVLLFGGTKKTQVQNIKTAKKYWEDYNA